MSHTNTQISERDGRFRGNSRRACGRRNGSVLLVVLVIVALLTLAVYTFTDFTLVEVEATTMYGRTTQTRTYADSGIELASALVADPIERAAEDYYHRPEYFAGILLQDSTVDRERGRCCVIAPNESDITSKSVRYGLIDESGKLNLNTATNWRLNEQQKRTLLMRLPEMTVEIADALLDWVDQDNLQRQYGAEKDYYEGLAEPYTPTNGPLSSLDELLLVRDVTPMMLFGEDVNRNGLMDDGEDLNGDGFLQRGWSAYLTLYSRESNLRSDGTPRLFVNQDDLVQLYDSLAAEFDADVARFVVAYRMNGASSSSSNTPGGSGGRGGRLGRGSRNMASSSASSNGGSSNDGSSSGDSSGNSPGANGVQMIQAGSGTNTITPQSNSNSSSSGSGASGSGNNTSLQRGSGRNRNTGGQGVQKGGLDVSAGAKVKINSIYDLVDATVQAQVNGQQTQLESPWKTDSRDLQQRLTIVLDALTTTDSDVIEGRVNINQAKEEVLIGLPNFPETLAQAITLSRTQGANGEPANDLLNSQSTSAWLLFNGLADIATMRKIDQYITTRGDVFRLQSVGYFDSGGPATRLEAVLDATEQPPKIVFFRDLTELGAGYSRTQLSAP